MLQRSLPINFKHLGPTDLRKYTEWWRCYPPRTDERWRDMYHSFYPYLFHHSNDTLSLYPEINKNPRTWQPHQLQTVYDAVREDRYDAFLRIREKFPELYEDTHQWDKPPVFGEFNQFYTIRTGMVGMRVKYCREFDKFGNAYELTMIWVPDNQVVGHGRSSLHVGAMNVQPEFLEPNVLSYYVRSGVSPKQVRHKFRITPDSFVPIGTNLDVRHFRVGQEVSIRCMTFDYGFQGVVKRFGHDGGFAWMGESRWHRRPGSIGAQGAHRVWPGTALPGWMGGDARYFYHKPIYRIDYKNSLIYVVGKIPCDVGAYMTIEDTDHILGKTQWSLNRGYPPFPTFIPDPKEDLATMATDECQLVAPSLLGFMRDSAISTAQITQTDIEDASQVKQQVAAPKQEIYDYRKYRESKRKARKEYLADLRRRNKEKEPLRLQKQEEYRQAKARKYSKLK